MRFRSLGSTALHLAYVAKGAMIGMVATTVKIWDVAAGAIIIERAGGTVTDLDGNNLFPVSLEDYTAENSPVMATNKKIHEEVLKIFTG